MTVGGGWEFNSVIRGTEEAATRAAPEEIQGFMGGTASKVRGDVVVVAEVEGREVTARVIPESQYGAKGEVM